MGCGSSSQNAKHKTNDYNRNYNEGYDYASRHARQPEDQYHDWRDSNMPPDENAWKDKANEYYPYEHHVPEQLNRNSAPSDYNTEDETPFDDDNISDKRNYSRNEMGLLVKVIDGRRKFLNEDNEKRPQITPGNLYVDTSFPLKTAIIKDNKNIEWKRPKEFMDKPKLFTDGATSFDIGQGTAGTCWFLSVVAEIAGNNDKLKQVIPEDAYRIDDSRRYDGVFHARFFKFGKWEDVFIDDYLPVVNKNQLWGARSASDENELWVALLEKAFAKMHGSYDAIYGGQPGDADLLLTGGICERVDLHDCADEQKALVLFSQIKKRLEFGCRVSCVVLDEHDKYNGLVGGHAYSVLNVHEHKASKTKLIRMRNPWGSGEWKGAWSDGSAEWSSIPQNSVAAPNKDEGEFYVSLQDFMKYFSHTVMCSQTPDFDCDGKPDDLNYVTHIYGEWSGNSAAGFHNRLQNQRFTFTVTENGLVNNDYMPVVVQMIQQPKKTKIDFFPIRCDIFKVLADKIQPNGRQIALENLSTSNNLYTSELQATFRFKLKRGRYVIIASTAEKNQEKAYLLRIFTPAALENVKEIPLKASIMSCENEMTFDVRGRTYNLTFEKTLFGEFIAGRNAGGQVSNRNSYHINPQYLITVPEGGNGVPLIFHIMQPQTEPMYPLGIRVFQLDKGTSPPLGIKYLYENYDECPSNTEGTQSKFVVSLDVSAKYLLQPGRYIALVHLDKPNTEKPFCIVFRAAAHVKVKGFQTG